MILVVAGTLDGRELAAYLKGKGIAVTVSVTSSYGGQLAAQSVDEVIVDKMTRDDFIKFFQDRKISAVVDASHPYAVGASQNILQAADAYGIRCIRYERKQTQLPFYENLYLVKDAAEAAQKAGELGETIFLTTGSRTLPVFKQSEALHNKRIIVRILPDADSFNICTELGILPKDVVAMQGPFSVQMNKVMFQDYQAQVVVTKDGGRTGGVDSKLEAAMQLNLPVVMITRPQLAYKNVTEDFEKIYEFLRG